MEEIKQKLLDLETKLDKLIYLLDPKKKEGMTREDWEKLMDFWKARKYAMVTKNPKTILKKKIRSLIRKFARRYNLGDEIGSLTFWDSENYKKAKKVSKKKRIGNYPYYSKSTKAIEDLAEEIYKEVNKEWNLERL